MTETREGTDVVERLTFTTRPVGDITILDFRSGGCRPASDVEIECLAEITRLRSENEALKEALRPFFDGFSSTTLIDGQEWVLVPKEPTTDMAEVARDWAQRDWKAFGDPKGYLKYYQGIYRAMLSAAPQPTAGGDGPDPEQDFAGWMRDAVLQDVTPDAALSAERARVIELEKLMTDFLAALDSGAVEMNSQEIGGHDDIPLHLWHEEWLHHARAALRALGQQDTGGADHG